MKKWIATYRVNISIFLIWLFHVSALIGTALGHESWFIQLTPLNLSICFALVVWCSWEIRSKLLPALLIPFTIGMMAEMTGVNFGLIFGNYSYGENLGPKIFGVPWMIGINWALLVYATQALARYFTDVKWMAALCGALLMVVLDLVMECVAPNMDFWQFENEHVPIQNYIGWFVTGLIAHLLFTCMNVPIQKKLGTHMYAAFFVFFFFFLLMTR